MHKKTREQLAEIAEISPHFLFEIETGRKSMKAQTIINLAKALDVTTDYIPIAVIYFLGSACRSPMTAPINGCGNYIANFSSALFDGLVVRDRTSSFARTRIGAIYKNIAKQKF